MTVATLLESVEALAPRAYELLVAHDAGAPAIHLEVVLGELGYADEVSVPADEKSSTAWRIVYSMALAALDLARTKVKKAKAGPAEAEFRAEEKYLLALLRRAAQKAGIPDPENEALPDAHSPFEIHQVPYYPPTDT